MDLHEAQEFLEDNGYILKEASTYKGYPLLRILWEKLLYLDDEERKLHTHSNNPDKWIDVDFDGGSLRIYRTNIGIRGEFDTGRKLTYKTTGQNKWDAATECAKFIISVINGEIDDRKSQEKLKIKEAQEFLNSKGYILEDTDDWDEADMPVSFTKKNREETVKRHNGRNWYSSAGVDAMANKHDDLEDKVRQAYDFNIKSLFYGVEKELQKIYKKVHLEATDYDDVKKSQLVRYYFKSNKNSYMLEVMYYDEDGVIVIQIMDEDEVGIERDDFSITTVDEAIKDIIDFVNYNVV